VTIFVFFFMLASTAMLKYLPHHIMFLRRRAMYYLWGGDASGAANVGGMLMNGVSGGGVRLEL
jgi:hypothetical protein